MGFLLLLTVFFLSCLPCSFIPTNGFSFPCRRQCHHADDSVLHLIFFYLINLNVMTVKTKVTTATEMTTPISAG